MTATKTRYPDSFVAIGSADTLLGGAGIAGLGTVTFTVSTLPPGVTAAPFSIQVDSERMRVTTIGGTGNKDWTVLVADRGYGSTTPATHSAGAPISLSFLESDLVLVVNGRVIEPDYIQLDKRAVPSTPPTDTLVVYMDTTTEHLTVLHDDSSTRDLEATGGLVLLEQHTASSSAQLDFTSFISSSYDQYMIELLGIVPATNGSSLLCRMGYGGGPTYDSGSNYSWQYARVDTGGSVFGSGNASDTDIILMEGIKSTDCADGSYKLFRPQDTTLNRRMMGDIVIVQNDSTFYRAMFGGSWNNTANAMTALRFYMSAGNIASGTIRIYGLAK